MGAGLSRKTVTPAWLKKTTAALLVMALLVTLDYACQRNRVHFGVSLLGVSLGGLEKDEAGRKIAELWEKTWRESEEICFSFNNESWSIRGEELGVSLALEETLAAVYSIGREKNFILSYPQRMALLISPVQAVPQFTVDKDKFAGALEPIAAKLRKDPVDARFALDEGKKYVRVIPESDGVEVDLEATLKSLYSYLEKLPNGGSVEVCTLEVPAKVRAKDLEKLGVEEEVASASTLISASSPNRKHNIALAASLIDGYLLLPGEVFSFNGVVGETTAEKGYKTAPVIVNRQLVDGVGGGICQVSSTLYNAALLAGLEIKERANHSLPVGYLPPGLDATVAFGWLDLKFVNNTNHGIWIRSFLENDVLTVSLYGSPVPGREIRVFTTDLVTIAPKTRIIETTDLPPGEKELVNKGQPGYRVNVWRAFYQDGEEIKKEKLSNDYYHPVEAEYRVGTLPEPGEESGKENGSE